MSSQGDSPTFGTNAEPGIPPGVSATRKRKDSTMESGAQRIPKYRASQACQYCRIRKVRCDVLMSEGGCTNCRLDHRECVLLASRRGKADRGQAGGASEEPGPPFYRPPDPTGVSNVNVEGQNGRTSHEPSCTPVDQAGADDVPICVTFHRDDEHIASEQQSANGETTTDCMSSRALDVSQEAMSSALDHHPSPSGMTPLPTFIAPFPSRISSEDLDFLARKGALTVPEPELRAEILRGYIFCVYPFMPMMDLKQFVDAVLNDRKDVRISLLLFQAVMFAGLSSLEQHLIHRLGFESAKDAREVLFTGVKLLFEFDVESDSMAVVQALLLMSSWYSKWNEWKDTWYWMGLALLVAHNIGLHREPTPACGSDRIRRCRRKLWWSLYIRDRMLALGTRRPMRIRDDDFDVAMLTLEDFDIEPLTYHGMPFAPDAEEQTRTALMCIKLAKLCVCIGHVLSTQYTTLSTQPNISHKMMVVPRRDEERAGDLRKCDKEISEWLQALAPNIYRSGSVTPQAGSHSCSDVHWAMLNLAHLTLINVLHRTQALQPSTETAEAEAVRRASRAKVKDSARNITKITQTLLRRNQVRFLGLNGITALLAACLSHMVDIRSEDEDVRDASIFRFYQSMQVLQAMRSMYTTADSAVSFLTSVIRKAGLSLPAQVVFPSADLAPGSAGCLAGPWMSDNGYSRPNNETDGRNSCWSTKDAPSQTTGADWLASQSQPGSQPPRSTQLSALPESERQVPDNSSGEASAAAIAGYGTVSMTRDGQAKGPGIFPFDDTHFGDLFNQSVNEAFFDWNSDVHRVIDLEPILYNFDFTPDTFGCLNNRTQGI